MMWVTIKNTAVSIHQSFHKSGTIVFARLQVFAGVLVGAIWFGLTSVDLAPLIGNPKYVAIWLIFSGAVQEFVRKSRTFSDDSGHLLPRDPNLTVVVNNNETAPTAPATPVPTDSTTK